MKRIDDKIKEIEKKDKTNRIIFIVVLALVAAWYIYVSQKTIKSQGAQITELEIKQTDTYKELEAAKEKTDSTLTELQRSLRPEEYWEFIEDEDSNEAYIGYLTNTWGIERTEIDKAIGNLSADAKGESGWLYVGKIINDSYEQPDDGQIAKVVWRKDHEDNSISGSEPRINDVIQLVRTRNRKTRKSPNSGAASNTEGWRPGTKAFIADKRMNQIEVWVQIKYY